MQPQNNKNDNNEKTTQIHFFYLYYLCTRILFVQRFEMPKRYENLLKWLRFLWDYIAVIVVVVFSGEILDRIYALSQLLAFFQSILFVGLFFHKRKKMEWNEMYSSEMVGFSPFWEKITCTFSELVGGTRIYSKNQAKENKSEKQETKKKENPPYDERKLQSFIFEIIFRVSSEHCDALMLENTQYSCENR